MNTNRRAAHSACGNGGGLELLERRRLFAVDAELLGGVLTIASTGASDKIIVAREITASGDMIYVYDNDINPVEWRWPTADVTKIVGDLSGGNDEMTISSTDNLPKGGISVNIPAEIRGGADNDTIQGGDANDTLYGSGGKTSSLSRTARTSCTATQAMTR